MKDVKKELKAAKEAVGGKEDSFFSGSVLGEFIDESMVQPPGGASGGAPGGGAGLGDPSSGNLLAALIIAVLYDALDIAATIAFPGVNEAVDIPLNAIFNKFIFAKLLKNKYKGITKAGLWAEIAPFVDALPIYTFSILAAMGLYWIMILVATGVIIGFAYYLLALPIYVFIIYGVIGILSAVYAAFRPNEGRAVFLLFFLSSLFVGGLYWLMTYSLLLFTIGLFVACLVGFIFLTRRWGLLAGLAFIALIIGSIFFTGFAILPSVEVNPDSPVGNAIATIKITIQNLGQTIKQLPEKAKAGFEKQKAIALGDYYTGEVDKKAQERLGVYLENIKFADERLYADMPITLFADLTAQTLDDPINLTISCNAGDKEADTVYPQKEFEVDTYEDETIDCIFDAGTLKEGVKTFNMSADFNFKTMSYVKSHFMDKDRLRAFRREGIDPLDQYGIPDKNPVAIYTNGPVKVGMGFGKPPIGLDPDLPESIHTLGITVENAWEGRVLRVTSLVVMLPKGFEMIEINGLTPSKISCAQANFTDRRQCDDQEVNVYMLIDPFGEIKTFKTMRAHIKIDRSNYDTVLGTAPVATHYFKVVTSYDFRLEKFLVTTIRKPIAKSGDISLTAPTITNANVINIAQTKVKITWTTDRDTLAEVYYWPKGNELLKGKVIESNYKTDHTKEISGLAKATEYEYIIQAIDNQNRKTEKRGTFKT